MAVTQIRETDVVELVAVENLVCCVDVGVNVPKVNKTVQMPLVITLELKS